MAVTKKPKAKPKPKAPKPLTRAQSIAGKDGNPIKHAQPAPDRKP